MSKLLGGMVIVAEGGFVATMSFMKEIQLRGIQHDLKGWWWSSDKGLIQDPEDSDEIVVKAQTMYDALTGKPVYVNGVRMFQSHTPQEIRQLLGVNRVDLLQLGEPPIKKIEQPEEIEFPPLVNEGSYNYETAFTFTTTYTSGKRGCVSVLGNYIYPCYFRSSIDGCMGE